MGQTPQTIYLKDYKPPTFLAPKVDLLFELFDDKAHVRCTTEYERNPESSDDTKELFLNGRQLKLITIERNQEPLDPSQYQQTEEGLTLKDCPDRFTLTTLVELKPQDNKAFSGLYKTNTVFCTQMEAQGFRRTTFFQDRPDILSRYTTTLVADKKRFPVLLSNGNLAHQEDLAEGRHSAQWEDPFPKPCYLFALVAGDLDWIEDSYLTRSRRRVDLRIYVDKGKSDRARFAMDSLKQSMKWDEDTYRLEYDLDIYNIVAVDDFNMGAMENKGLNIFNSKFVLASPKTATDNEYQGIQRVIGHEYFHNWSGNRVTCRDWFQLSLKEGLTVFRDQEFSSDLNSRAVKRIEDVAALRSRQFPEDSGPMAHPVRPSSYIAIDNFYTVTVYEKGAEVIRMLQTLLGVDMFKKGVAKYFELFDGQAVTTDDWIRAMEMVSGRDLAQFKLWYDQAGTPQVHVQHSYESDKQCLHLEISQKTLDPINKNQQAPFHMPIRLGLISDQGSPLDFSYNQKEALKEVTLELTDEKHSFLIEDVYQPPIISINREFSAPIQLHIEQTDEELYRLMSYDADSFNRWESAQTLYRQRLLNQYKSSDTTSTEALPTAFVESLQHLIRKGQEDPALTACLLQLPKMTYLGQFLEAIAPQTLDLAYKQTYQVISESLHELILNTYGELQEKRLGHSPQDMALRSFKNELLNLLYRHDETQGQALFRQHYQEAQNMTDSIAALQRLSVFAGDDFTDCMNDFANSWAEDRLVMNKWLSIKALAPNTTAFSLVKEASESSHFDKSNPNNVFSLLYNFAGNNWGAFHKSDGLAVAWFSEQVIDVDKRNPQVSSKLCSCLNNWKKLSTQYQQAPKAALEKIIASSPSDNLFEVADRALKH